MRRSLGIMTILAVLAMAFAVPPAGGASGNKYPVIEDVFACDNGDIIYHGPAKLWPPNHKYVNISIEAVADNQSDEVMLDTEGAHNEVNSDGSEFNGSGNTPVGTDVNPAAAHDQGTGSAEVFHDVRAERAGTGDGRIYTIEATANFGGEECIHEFTIEVPHDQRGGAGWK